MKIESFCKKWALLFFLLIILGCNSSSGGGSGIQDGRDTEAPSVPANLSASKSDSAVQISWATSTDNSAVTGYKIYRNGAYLASSSITSYTDSDITAAKQYCYTVSALDSAGNESVNSGPACVDSSNGKVKWRFETEFPVTASLALAPDGTVYAADGTSLYAVNPDGSLKWKYSPDEKILSDSSPVIVQDGSICFKTDFFLYVVKPDGTLKWKFETSKYRYYTDYSEYVAAGQDGTIYAVSSDSIYAINQDGTLKWQSSGLSSNITIDQEGLIYSQGYDLRAFSPDGTPKSQIGPYATDVFKTASSPVIGNGGTVLVSVHHAYAHGVPEYNNLYALKSDGTLLWVNTADKIFGTPVIGVDGTIYACASASGNGKVLICSMTPDGAIKWKSDEGDYFMRSLAVDSGGTVYIISMDGYLNAIGEGGKLKWKSRIGASYASPAIAGDGTIFVGSENSIYAITSDSPGLASGIWSRSLGDNANSRSLMVKKADSEPPSIPTNVTALATASSIIQIDWDASTDSLNPVTGYKVFRNGEFIGLKGRGFTDSYLNYSTKYCYQISAIDAVGNESAKSPEICATPLQPAEGVLKWKYRTSGVPSIEQDGSIVLWSGYRRFALNPDGSVKWSYQTGNIDAWPLSIGSDGSIYAGYMFAFYPGGNEKWRYEGISAYSSPAISNDGTIYASGDNAFWAVKPDGTLKWKYQEANSGGYLISFYPSSIASDGTVYSPSYSGFIYAFNPDGSVKWKYQTDTYSSASPAIGPDGTVFVTNYNNGLLAINPDGTLKWKIKPDGADLDNPVIGADGTIYSAGSNGVFYSISPDGQIKWRYNDNETNFFTTTLIGADGILYVGTDEGFGTNGGSLLALRPDGTLKWKHKAGTKSVNPFVITSDGTLYFGAQGSSVIETGFLCAIQTSSMGLATGGWPKIYHDNQNTGRMP